MSACLLRDRTLILGIVAVLATLAAGSNGGAQSVGPDGSRQSPDPIGGPNAPSATKRPSGDLDTTFAGDGTLWSYLPGNGGPPTDPRDEATAVAVDGGGILVATHGAVWAFAIRRYTADGTLDTTFGTNGPEGLSTPFAGVGGQVRAMAIQPDGRIVVGGFAGGGFALARLMPDGSLDASFGSGGQVLSDFFPGASELAYGMALQVDGRIVLAGQADGGAGVVVTLARYNSDGSLDTTFGAGGLVLSGFPGAANAVAVQPDGRIVVAGLSFLVTRFDADGSLDAGFGSGGRVAVPFGGPGESEANAILVQPDGRIVVGGATLTIYGSQDEFALARLNPDGSLDKPFGHGGMVTTDFYGRGAGIGALLLQPDGRLVAAGSGYPSHQSPSSHFALARFESNGQLDHSFGKDGLAVAAIEGSSFYDYALAVTAQPDGRIVAAGTIRIVCEIDGCDFNGYALARFLP
jgi:uncharacterized delta-60 repeat protein